MCFRYVYPATPDSHGAKDYVIERRVSADGTSGSEKTWAYCGLNSRDADK